MEKSLVGVDYVHASPSSVQEVRYANNESALLCSNSTLHFPPPTSNNENENGIPSNPDPHSIVFDIHFSFPLLSLQKWVSELRIFDTFMALTRYLHYSVGVKQ